MLEFLMNFPVFLIIVTPDYLNDMIYNCVNKDDKQREVIFQFFLFLLCITK